MQIDIQQIEQIFLRTTELIPEIYLCGLYLVVLIAGFFRRSSAYIVELTVIGVVIHILVLFFFFVPSAEGGLWQVDAISQFAKVFMSVALLLAIILFRKNSSLAEEYYSLLIAILLGAQLLTMARHFLIMFIAVELISLSSYGLVFFRFRAEATASAIRYLIFGGASSAISLYGISLIYGINGTFFWHQIDVSVVPKNAAIAICFLALASLFFKISLFPFHVWVSDVYQQLPLQVLAFLSVVPKIAAGVALYQFSKHIPPAISIFLLGSVALLSMLVGNLGALSQKGMRKLFAFSSIAHAGFLIVAIIPRTISGVHAFLFYGIVYALMNYAFVWILDWQESLTEDDSLTFWRGIGNIQPFVGIEVTTLMISLVGLPITAGFTTKLLAFSALWEYYELEKHVFLIVVLIVGLLNALISLFYYLKIPYLMYFQKHTTANYLSFARSIVLTVLIFPLLVLFFFPNVILNFLFVLIK
ncbi:MAG: NADH-quinone oxidoreductase subunit N [Cytophagales bacterium]|nr:NADH-quinone oxidoreductase subunit N [Cytophagales bacterium]MDW8383857.1 NADH-quinone oxidoreductase subunit N [Flammeovirgaceae bacterium]